MNFVTFHLLWSSTLSTFFFPISSSLLINIKFVFPFHLLSAPHDELCSHFSSSSLLAIINNVVRCHLLSAPSWSLFSIFPLLSLPSSDFFLFYLLSSSTSTFCSISSFSPCHHQLLFQFHLSFFAAIINFVPISSFLLSPPSSTLQCFSNFHFLSSPSSSRLCSHFNLLKHHPSSTDFCSWLFTLSPHTHLLHKFWGFRLEARFQELGKRQNPKIFG